VRHWPATGVDLEGDFVQLEKLMHFGQGLAVGFGLILVAATMNGAFALPMKSMPDWRWENTWMVWTIASLWVLPPVVALASIPGLAEIYRVPPAQALVKMAVFGVLWGIGLAMLGLSYPMIGVAVAFAVGLGSAAAAGSLLPLLAQHAQQVFTRTGELILLGTVIMVAGVGVCGWAGREREREQGITPLTGGKSFRGFLVAFIGGTLTAALNIALAYGDPILRVVRVAADDTSLAANAVWVPVLFAGGVPGVAYCACLMRRNSSSQLYLRAPKTYWLLGLVMSTLWYGSVILYGVGTIKIGQLGVIIGWPIFMSGAVLAASGWGALTGEWQGSRRKSRLMMAGGVSLLIMAVAILGMAGSPQAESSAVNQPVLESGLSELWLGKVILFRLGLSLQVRTAPWRQSCPVAAPVGSLTEMEKYQITCKRTLTLCRKSVGDWEARSPS